MASPFWRRRRGRWPWGTSWCAFRDLHATPTKQPALTLFPAPTRTPKPRRSINNTLLARYGTPTLDAVQQLFKSAARPVHVLFRRSHVDVHVGGAK